MTTKRFTGQYHEQGLPGGEGLSYYNARWYDAQVGMFISADTLVPSPLAPQTFNRYAYVGGNPLRYTDPTGHMLCADCDGGGGGYRTRSEPKRVWLPFISYQPPARPQPLAVRTPAPQATSVVQLPRTPVPTWTPAIRLPFTATPVQPIVRAAPTATPTPGTFLNAYTGPRATPSGHPADAGQVNWPALGWGASFGLLYEGPAEMMERGLTGKYLAKGALKSMLIAYLLAGGPLVVALAGQFVRSQAVSIRILLLGVGALCFAGLTTWFAAWSLTHIIAICRWERKHGKQIRLMR